MPSAGELRNGYAAIAGIEALGSRNREIVAPFPAGPADVSLPAPPGHSPSLVLVISRPLTSWLFDRSALRLAAPNANPANPRSDSRVPGNSGGLFPRGTEGVGGAAAVRLAVSWLSDRCRREPAPRRSPVADPTAARSPLPVSAAGIAWQVACDADPRYRESLTDAGRLNDGRC
jgi:hypothetical protein